MVTWQLQLIYHTNKTSTNKQVQTSKERNHRNKISNKANNDVNYTHRISRVGIDPSEEGITPEMLLPLKFLQTCKFVEYEKKTRVFVFSGKIYTSRMTRDMMTDEIDHSQ